MLLMARSQERVAEATAFLKARQCRSGDRLIDGGWAVNTSHGIPVSECTALVLWVLARCNIQSTASGPDLRRAVQWLSRNQNPDGGWGSFLGRPSRTWLTALSVRALSAARAAEGNLRRGVRWLQEHCDSAGGWPEVPGSPPDHDAFGARFDRVARGRHLCERPRSSGVDLVVQRVDQPHVEARQRVARPSRRFGHLDGVDEVDGSGEVHTRQAHMRTVATSP
jgi:hypothetical protein